LEIEVEIEKYPSLVKTKLEIIAILNQVVDILDKDDQKNNLSTYIFAWTFCYKKIITYLHRLSQTFKKGFETDIWMT
jgi:hypothetical protein